MTGSARILAVVGMRAEARLLARVGITAVVGGGNPDRLATELDRLLSPCPRVRPSAGSWGRGGEFMAVLSFGVAGGLDPLLKAGDLVIAFEIRGALSALSALRPAADSKIQGALGALGALPTDPAWAERLRAALPGARSGPVLGQDNPAVSAGDKFILYSATGTLAVDMESHVAAVAAARYALPFAALRAISDPAGRTLPPAAVAGFGADGRADIGAVLRALARDPRQLPALIRTGVEAGRAFKALKAAAVALVW